LHYLAPPRLYRIFSGSTRPRAVVERDLDDESHHFWFATGKQIVTLMVTRRKPSSSPFTLPGQQTLESDR
jgi:hypothetical protein